MMESDTKSRELINLKEKINDLEEELKSNNLQHETTIKTLKNAIS